MDGGELVDDVLPHRGVVHLEGNVFQDEGLTRHFVLGQARHTRLEMGGDIPEIDRVVNKRKGGREIVSYTYV